MKASTVLLLIMRLLVSSEALAQDQGVVRLQAGVPVQLLNLQSEKHEPIYGEEPYTATCSREVLSGYQSVCHTVSDQVCQGGGEVCTTEQDSVCNSNGCVQVPRRVCHSTPQTCTDVPRRVCENQAVYSTEYYSCTRYRTVVVGQRLVKTFQHQIEVRAEDPASLGASELRLGVRADEASLKVALLSSFSEALLSHSVEKVREQDVGDRVMIVSRIVIRRSLSAAQVRKLNGATLSNLVLDRSTIRMDLDGLSELSSNLVLSIRLKRTPKVWFHSTLYEGEVSSASLRGVGQGEVLKLAIPLSKLGVEELSKNRHELKVQVRLDQSSVLNARDFEAETARRIEGILEGVKPAS
jgi:hypothetical protein